MCACSVAFILQSTAFSCQHLESRCEAFLQQFKTSLEQMTDESFKTQVLWQFYGRQHCCIDYQGFRFHVSMKGMIKAFGHRLGACDDSPCLLAFIYMFIHIYVLSYGSSCLLWRLDRCDHTCFPTKLIPEQPIATGQTLVLTSRVVLYSDNMKVAVQNNVQTIDLQTVTHLCLL